MSSLITGGPGPLLFPENPPQNPPNDPGNQGSTSGSSTSDPGGAETGASSGTQDSGSSNTENTNAGAANPGATNAGANSAGDPSQASTKRSFARNEAISVSSGPVLSGTILEAVTAEEDARRIATAAMDQLKVQQLLSTLKEVTQLFSAQPESQQGVGGYSMTDLRVGEASGQAGSGARASAEVYDPFVSGSSTAK